MHKQRIGILVVGALGVLSTFLPWASAGGFSVNGIDAGWRGYLNLGLYAAVVLFTLVGDKLSAMKGGSLIVPIIFGIGATGMGVINIMDLNKAGVGGFIGIGLYLAAIAGVGVVIVALALQKK